MALATSIRRGIGTLSNTARYMSNRRLKAVVLDWSGTTVDIFSMAPARALVETFAKSGVQVSMPSARSAMGVRKEEHIRTMASQPEVEQLWLAKHGRKPNEDDINRLINRFVTLRALIDCTI